MTTTQEETIKFSELVNFTPKQKEADRSLKLYKYLLYGGAMGGGKSYWLRWQLVKRLMYFYGKYNLTKVVVGLFCEDYPSLKDRQLSKIGTEFPPWMGTMHSDHKEYGRCFILAPEYGSGVIAFRNLDDPSKYQSAEFATVGVDELTKNLKEVFDFLRTRMRWPGLPAHEVKFISGSNPGDVGHGWVKDMWINKIYDENEVEKELFHFVRSKAEDNPHLDTQYYKALDSLPEQLRKAYRDGDWDIFKGQYFTEWRRDLHVIKPFPLLDSWKRIICIDYGYAKPAAAYWLAIDYDGFYYVYRELYKTGLTYKDLTKEIIAMTPLEEKISYWTADPSIWAKKDSPLSGAEEMQQTYKDQTGKTLVLLQGNNDRIQGWNRIRELLKPRIRNDKVEAGLRVFENCINFIRTFPGLVYDAIKVEDLDSDGEDHPADAVRYGVMTKPVPPKREETRIKKKRDSGYVVRMAGY